MKSKMEIIAELAQDRVVETMVEKTSKSSLTPSLKDLCQMVYEILLGYDEDKLQDLYQHKQLGFFLARIIMNQYHSQSSPYYVTIRRFSVRSECITEKDIDDE